MTFGQLVNFIMEHDKVWYWEEGRFLGRMKHGKRVIPPATVEEVKAYARRIALRPIVQRVHYLEEYHPEQVAWIAKVAMAEWIRSQRRIEKGKVSL